MDMYLLKLLILVSFLLICIKTDDIKVQDRPNPLKDYNHVLLVRFPNLEKRSDKELLKLIYNNPYKTNIFND